nr:uncharacterized protein LOC112939900 [Oryza sativa Japonica Group]
MSSASSTPPSPTSAALDTAADAVAKAVRAAFQVLPGMEIDPTMANTVVDSAATRASDAARNALSPVLSTLLSGTPATTGAPATTSAPAGAGIAATSVAATHGVAPATTAPLPGTMPADLAALFASARLAHGVHTPEPTVPDFSRPPATPLDDAALAALHAQAVSVLNIKALVPVTLDVAATNYTRWHGLFLVALGKYALTDHVLSDAYHFDRADWVQMDCVVLAWLFGTISFDLLQDVLATDTTARLVWRGLEYQFLGNSEQRALNLTTEFHTFRQGDLSVDEYCRKMKTFADSLGDVGEPVRDRTLVLNTLSGLSEKFNNLRSLVPMQRPFPTFAELRSMLRLEELSKPNHAASASSAVFLATGSTTNGGKGANPAHGTGYGAGNQGGGGKGNSNRRRRGGNGGGGGGGGGGGNSNQGGGSTVPAQAQGAQWRAGFQWPSPHNPWAGTIHMWPGPLGRGVLGPRPAPSPFAGAALAGPSGGPLPGQVYPAPVPYQTAAGLGQQAQLGGVGQFGPSQPPTPVALQHPLGWFGGAPSQWDQASLAGSFNTTTLHQPATNDWYMDTGATAHMTSDTGILSLSHPPNPNSPSHIVVGNGSTIPVTSIGHSKICHPNRSFTLRDILCSPAIIKNLISVRRFVIDNWCSVEFDPFGFSVKDLRTRTVIARFNSSGPLYSLHHALPPPPAATALLANSSTDLL